MPRKKKQVKPPPTIWNADDRLCAEVRALAATL